MRKQKYTQQEYAIEKWNQRNEAFEDYKIMCGETAKYTQEEKDFLYQTFKKKTEEFLNVTKNIKNGFIVTISREAKEDWERWK